MKERPILFSAPMVKAILEGRKAQTRRTVKGVPAVNAEYAAKYSPHVVAPEEPGGEFIWKEGLPGDLRGYFWARCPYGVPGDRLWVRETCFAFLLGDDVLPGGATETSPVSIYENGNFLDRRTGCFFAADGPKPAIMKDARWKSPRFMPRWASRLTLEVKEVRVQRLQDISTDDVLAEGLIRSRLPGYDDGDGMVCLYSLPEWDHGLESAQAAYRQLYESINGPGSWEANPWVWCVTFDIAAADTTGESTTL